MQYGSSGKTVSKYQTIAPQHADDNPAKAKVAPHSPTAQQAGSAKGESKARSLSKKRLNESKTDYRRLFECGQEGTLLIDVRTGAVTDVNPSLLRMLEYSRGEFLERTLWDIVRVRDVGTSEAVFRELKAKRCIRYENLPVTTKSGRSTCVDVVTSIYQVKGRAIIQCRVGDTRQARDASQSEEPMLQAQKMEAVGQLAGGLAHDFNNLLGVILGYCELLEGEEALSQPFRAMVQEIHNAGESGKKLTQHLLAFSRRQVLQPVVMDLNATVHRMEKMLSRLIGENIQLGSVLGSELGRINADPSQIELILMNLAINARDAMHAGGKIVIETANAEIDEATANEQPPLEPGRYVVLTVRDTGTGMSAETRSHIFEPFFTTKPPGQGTGLGLSTVFGVVKQSGGVISVFSEPGSGATFKIHFPRCDKAPAAIRHLKTKPIRGGTETILLVDDASALRGLTKRLLEGCGYTVLGSCDPAEALHIAMEHQGHLPLLVTDVMMPGFSGPTLAQKIAEVRPGIKVVYMSGYNDDLQSSVCGNDCVPCAQHCGFLEKPFTREGLLRKVREMLDSRT